MILQDSTLDVSPFEYFYISTWKKLFLNYFLLYLYRSYRKGIHFKQESSNILPKPIPGLKELFIASKRLPNWNLSVQRSSWDYIFLFHIEIYLHLPNFQLSSSIFRGPKKKAKPTPKRFFFSKSQNLVWIIKNLFLRLKTSLATRFKLIFEEIFFFPEMAQSLILGTFGLNVKYLQCKTLSKGLICIFTLIKVHSKTFRSKTSVLFIFLFFFYIFLKWQNVRILLTMTLKYYFITTPSNIHYSSNSKI